MKFEEIYETIKRARVIRNGATVMKFKSDKTGKGYKIVVSDSGVAKEVRMAPDEIRNRKIASRKRAMKMKGKMKQIARKRNRSMKKRINWV